MNAGAAPQPKTQVNFDVPAGATDCHLHIIGPPDQYPFTTPRDYSMPPALPDEAKAMHQSVGFDRCVIVTPSIYGNDNSATLWGLRAVGPSARGVAVVDEKTPEDELRELHAAGVRGIRLGFLMEHITTAGPAEKALQTAVKIAQLFGWHIEIYGAMTLLAQLKQAFAAAPVPLLFDHTAGAIAEKGVDQPGFADVVDIVRSGDAYITLGPSRNWSYPVGRTKPNYAGGAALAKALIDANPDRIVYGTDWPHPGPTGKVPYNEISPDFSTTDEGGDDGDMLNQLAVWAPDPATRQKILVDNPARLYGF